VVPSDLQNRSARPTGRRRLCGALPSLPTLERLGVSEKNLIQPFEFNEVEQQDNNNKDGNGNDRIHE
jgi:hypothetical protein